MNPLQGRWDEELRYATAVENTTIDLSLPNGTYCLFVGMGQTVLVESLVVKIPEDVDVSDDANITSISVQTDDATTYELISSTTGAKANLTAGKQLVWTGAFLLLVGSKIKLTIAGAKGADESTVCVVTAKYRETAAGGYLAASTDVEASSSVSSSPSTSVSSSPSSSPSSSVSSSPSVSASSSPTTSPSSSVSSSPSTSISSSPSSSPSTSISSSPSASVSSSPSSSPSSSISSSPSTSVSGSPSGSPSSSVSSSPSESVSASPSASPSVSPSASAS